MKRAGIKRVQIKNTNLPKTKVVDWGVSKVISKIDKAIELIYRRK